MPGASPVTLAISVCLSWGGNSRELIEPRDKQKLLSHLALCDPVVGCVVGERSKELGSICSISSFAEKDGANSEHCL